ncbi:endonuclease/exonuclease/phosphatase family protein [Salininema proteolyticum]|uniref:Endonuclease/exonuclease/phosphatase family protein n=1 Tax=Salininema proteolyticum TaxID=1607685 RepID=A0ABV8U0F2_9ACTN
MRFELALLSYLLLELLAVFLPGLTTVVGDAGSTPAELMGAYALGTFLLPFALLLLTGRLRRKVALLRFFALGAIAARTALPFTPDGWPMAATATAGTVAALTYLALATRFIPVRAFFASVFLAVAARTTLGALWPGPDLVWRDGLVPTAVGGLLALAAIAAVIGARHHAAESHPASFFLLGPALFLSLLYFANGPFAIASTGTAPFAVALAAPTAAWAAFGVIGFKSEIRPGPWLWGGILVLGTALTTFATRVGGDGPGLPAVAFSAVGFLALAFLLGQACALPRRPNGSPSTWLLLGFLAFLLLTFAYFAAYDMGYPNGSVPFLAAAALTAAAFAVHRSSRECQPLLTPPFRKRWAVVPALAAAAGIVVAHLPAAPATTAVPDSIRLAAYNIRMGFGQDGGYAVPEQIAALRNLDADLVVLTEVDRGWMLNGGQDTLREFAAAMDMEVHWAPAADSLWGDALLSRFPVETRSRPLPESGPTGAQALEARFDWHREPVSLFATHFQPAYEEDGSWADYWQVNSLGRRVGTAVEEGRHVIVAGDLNLSPAGPTGSAWDRLTGWGLEDPLAPYRPFPTSLGDGAQIDHILASPGVSAAEADNPAVRHSDHRPIAATLTLDEKGRR